MGTNKFACWLEKSMAQNGMKTRQDLDKGPVPRAREMLARYVSEVVVEDGQAARVECRLPFVLR